ncbi:MAG TPA: M48 family metallopeptidase [Bryobacteraceae bacterium]|nr:M48 family metallopeptidase [Bryobacteraceae bacterium]
MFMAPVSLERSTAPTGFALALGLCFALLLAATAAAQGPRQLKPGWNLFSKDQDIQLGKEAAAQVEKQYTVVRDEALVQYIRRIGAKLASTPEAGGYPYSFQVVADKSINAFALPGGPAFVHTGLLAAADNEAQVAGVLAHEISHVALRHGTSQASKANLFQLPALLASGMLGKSGSMLGQLAQLGIGLGTNSVLLKFSRTAESDADLLGTRIMAKAGYNPLEMARFFEKLEASGGARGPQFLSDHPNPGNRVKAVETEIGYLPRSSYTTGSANEFARIQKLAAAVPVPPPKQAASAQPTAAPSMPQIPVSRTIREYRASAYAISYPDNWQATAAQKSQGVTLAPREGYVQGSGGGYSIGAGAVVDFASKTGDLNRDTAGLLQKLAGENADMRTQEPSKSTRVNGQPALVTILQSRSPFAGETEVDTLVTVERPEGLFFVVLIAPQSMVRNMQGAFDAMLRSIRFSPAASR